MFGIGPMEMAIVGIIALLLFGKRLPEVARNMGKGITEFKKGMKGIDDDVPVTSSEPARPVSRPAATPERVEPIAPKFEPPTAPPANAEQNTAT